jgi:hypothetical protein
MGKKDKKEELPNTFNMLGSGGSAQQPAQGKGNLFGVFGGKSADTSHSASAPSTTSKDVFSSGTGGKTIQHNRTWVQMVADVQHWCLFPFSHGMEIELVICDDQGRYVEGEKVVHVLKELVNEAKKVLTQIFNNERSDFPQMPDYIRKKLKSSPYIKEYDDKGTNLGFDYQIENQYCNQQVRVDFFGRDGNVTMATIILELVTPPCQYAEELAYWAGMVFNIAKVCLPKTLHIMSTAINPTMKEYVNGLSHGDHHHCGSFASDQEKAQCYDMARNFLPHIVALTVNSPFINYAPTDVIKTMMVGNKPRITAPNCIRSIRLINNVTMLSNSNEPRKYIPYLPGRSKQEDEQIFLKTTEYASLYDSRFQDLFPFTRYGTIELRICDAQISICRRIGVAMLLEAIYYKARKILAAKKWVPMINSETLCVNRRSSIERGLIGVFKPVNLDRNSVAQYDPLFADCYLGPINQPYRFMFESVQGMFRYLKDVLVELGYLYSPFMKPLLQSVFGDITYAATPMCEAEYQLCLYDYKVKQGQQPNVFEDLKYFTIEYSKDPLQQPLTGELTLPDYMTK